MLPVVITLHIFTKANMCVSLVLTDSAPLPVGSRMCLRKFLKLRQMVIFDMGHLHVTIMHYIYMT